MTEHSSPWIEASGESHAPLPGDTNADVAIVGAGFSGLIAGLLLVRSGRRVVVVDMHRVGTGTTGHTTGKVTSPG